MLAKIMSGSEKSVAERKQKQNQQSEVAKAKDTRFWRREPVPEKALF